MFFVQIVFCGRVFLGMAMAALQNAGKLEEPNPAEDSTVRPSFVMSSIDESYKKQLATKLIN